MVKASGGSSSICWNMPITAGRSPALSGAIDSEQLPGMIEVTPCSRLGLAAPSQSSWTSKWVCGSMKPGATALPPASISARAGPSTLGPRAAIRPSFTATSPAKAGAPVPSTTRALRITRSYMPRLPSLPAYSTANPRPGKPFLSGYSSAL